LHLVDYFFWHQHSCNSCYVIIHLVTVYAWIIIGIGSVIVVAIIILALYSKSWCEYCKCPRLCWNEGFILDVFRFAFWLASRISVLNIIKCIAEGKVSRKCQYHIVDSYISVFAAAELAMFIIVASNPTTDLNCLALKFFIAYRLFDIFQVWFLHFVLPDWNPINTSRSLILVGIGYIEVIILYSLLVFMLKDDFIGITCFQQAFLYSLGNAITIGFGIIRPEEPWSYVIFVTQIMFVLLFLTAVVNRIIGRK